MSSKKAETPPHTYTVSVVGLSGTDAIRGPVGVGKSCLCNRFVRPAADDFYSEHPSHLSAADFNGQVINNDHFLYWGNTTRIADDRTEYHFNVIEQTEFLDDTTFAPLRSGRTDPYLKRCSQIKIQSAQKLMYICRDQLGLEDQFRYELFPSGKVNIDGFVCVVDVSRCQQRSLEGQLEFISKILLSLVKTKKPIVMAATKMDEGSDAILQELQKLVGRREFKGMIPVVETSAVSHVNTDLPFILLASLIDKSRAVKPKMVTYAEAARLKEEKDDAARSSYGSLLSSLVTDHRFTWQSLSKDLVKYTEYNQYVGLFGLRKTKLQFNKRISQLRQEFITKRKAELLRRIPGILEEFFPNLTVIDGRNWNNCLRLITQRSDFHERFVTTRERWCDDDLFLDSGDDRMPLDLLASQEVEAIFTQHINALTAEVQRQEYIRQFYDLITIHKPVLPGAPLTEMEVFFHGYDCYEKLSPHDRSDVYNKAQVVLKDQARKNFLELLYERMDVFYQYDDPDKSITQEDVEALMDLLRSEPKCKALSRCEEDRKVIMLNHLGFLQYPIKEQCPFRANCMELSLQRALNTKQKRSQVKPIHNWTPNPDEQQINLLIIGSDGLATDLVEEIRTNYEDDEYHFDDKVYSLDYRTIDDDVYLPQNSLQIPDFVAHGCICVYSTMESLRFIEDTVNKTFLAPSDEKLQYQGLPLVLMQALDTTLTEKTYLLLHDQGKALADRLKCEFIDVPDVIDIEDSVDFNQFYDTQIPRSMRDIAIQLANHDSVDAPHRPRVGDIRLLMCHMCADPYPVDMVLQPFLAMQSCQVVTNDRYHVIQFDTYIDNVKRRVEVILASYHEAMLLRDEYCHGYIMVYATRRKASYSMIHSHISKIPRIPSLVVAVNDPGHDDCDLLYTNKGKLLAQKHGCLFSTTEDFQTHSPYIELLNEVNHQLMMIKDDSLGYNTLDSTHNSSVYSENSPTDPYKQYNGSTGKKQWNDTRSALYLGSGWVDSNDVYYKDRIHAPLADRIETPDYEDPADALSDSSEEYALVHDALPAGKIQRVQSTLKREFRPAFPYTDSESDMSSLERNTFTRSPILHRRGMSPLMGQRVTSPNMHRRAHSPMATRTESNVATPERKSNSLPRAILHRVAMDSSWESNNNSTQTMRSETASEGSESAGDDIKRSETKRKKSFKSLRLRKSDQSGGDEEAGFLDRVKNTVSSNLAEKQRRKSIKRKQKEEEKVLRETQKSVRRKLKSRLKRQSYLFKTSGKVLQDYVQEEGQLIPKFVELCVNYLESEDRLLSEGLYRVPGNTAHVELLYEMFAHNNNIDIRSLDISVNAVATALKKFFSDLTEPLIPVHLNEELMIADSIPENSSRLLALRGVIKKLPPANHEVLRYLATHLYKTTKYSDVNNMTSSNLGICWSPTLIRAEIGNVEDMKSMLQALQDVTTSLIQQHGFFFYNEHEV